MSGVDINELCARSISTNENKIKHYQLGNLVYQKDGESLVDVTQEHIDELESQNEYLRKIQSMNSRRDK